MNFVFIYYTSLDESEGVLLCPIKSCIVLALLKYVDSWDNTSLVLVKEECSEPSIAVNIKHMTYHLQEKKDVCVSYCQLPVWCDNSYYCVAGLCSVLRKIIKTNADALHLLGFRENCLSACAEQSTWTKFCEIDSIHCVNNFFKQNTLWISHIQNLENKLKLPLKICNKANKNKILLLDQRYCDSTEFRLSDFILITCMYILNLHSKNFVFGKFPYVQKWYNQIMTDASIINLLCMFVKMSHHIFENISLSDNQSNQQDSTTVKLFTKSQKARNFAARSEDARKFINDIQLLVKQHYVGYGENIDIKIESIPYFALPESGDLPQNRIERKCQQLFSMAKAVMKICATGDTIVDFCSGGGHLGLLIAHLIPQCHVILLDNKPQSLSRAQMRAQNLKLVNIHIVQSNIDYFIGKFQVGICLHACGVASDLVMQMCSRQGASMVVSPCCYGKIKSCHTVQYPRSQWLRGLGITADDHYLMSHCADREEPDWMSWVDADRLEWAKENGYSVFLGKLTPIHCTPKNNLLIASKTMKIEDV